METKFKVGDLVKIVDDGKVYTTFDTMFKEMGFLNTEYNSDENSVLSLPLEVFAVRFFNNKFLYGIRKTYKDELLFCETGLELHEDFSTEVLTETKNDCGTHLHNQLVLPTNVEVSISERLEGLLKLTKDNQQWLHNQLLELKQDITTLKSELN